MLQSCSSQTLFQWQWLTLDDDSMVIHVHNEVHNFGGW